MRASFAVKLANIWMKSFQYQIKSRKEIIKKHPKSDFRTCLEFNRSHYRGRGVKCEKSENRFRAKCQNIDGQLYAKMKDMVWYCSDCQKIYLMDSEPETERLLFERYVDETIHTVSGKQDSLLRKANNFHRKSEFKMERTDENGKLVFLDMNIKAKSCKEINCERYKKPTDTGTVLNFHNCTPIHIKKNVEKGTVHSTFGSTNTCKRFDKALK